MMFPQGTNLEMNRSSGSVPVCFLFIVRPWTSPRACQSLGFSICNTELMTPSPPVAQTIETEQGFPPSMVVADNY